MSLIQTLVAIVDRPSAAMKAVTDKPRSWLLPAILIVAGMLALLYVSMPYQMELADQRSAEMVESMASRMSEEQAQAVRQSVRPMTPMRYWLGAGGTGLVLAILGWVLRGAVVHFSSMAAGGSSSWPATFAVCTWAMLPFFVRDLVKMIYVLTSRAILEHEGLSFLVASGNWLQDSQSAIYLLLANVDPFVLWHLVLLGIAISVATRLGRAKAGIMAVVIWAAFTGLKLVPVVVSTLLTRNVLG